jgi:hypothetical protein
MASGHVNRTQRPNTWLHRPSLRREDSPCQLGAVHTWPIAGLDEPRVVDVEIGDRLVDADEPDLPADDRDLERPVRFAILFTKVFAISSSHGGHRLRAFCYFATRQAYGRAGGASRSRN